MKKLISSIFLLSLLLGVIFANPALAFNEGCPAGTPEGTTCLPNYLGTDSPQVLIGRIINSIMGIVGSIALLMFIFGGLTWMTSGGSADKVKKGRDILMWSAIGLAVLFMSYGLVYFVIKTIK